MLNTHCFPKASRLRQNHEFKTVFAEQKRLYTPCYLLYFCPNQLTRARLGVIVSKRNVRLATNRNRIKRQAREFFRQHAQVFAGYDMILLGNRAAATTDNQGLRRCLKKLVYKFQKDCKSSV